MRFGCLWHIARKTLSKLTFEKTREMTPIWSPDGRELYYLSGDNSAMAVAVETEPTPRFETPRMLFKNTNLGFTMTSGHPWDIHPDGKRFLMMKPPEAASPKEKGPKPRVTVVLNWDEELNQRLPMTRK